MNDKAKTITAEKAESVLAFCGIAHPEPFVEALKKQFKAVDFLRFADHHAYTENDIASIFRRFDTSASKLGNT